MIRLAGIVLLAAAVAGCGAAQSPGLAAAQDTACHGVGFAVTLDESAVGVPLAEVPGRVRVIVTGLRPSDEIREPPATNGSTAAWHVIRDGRAVATVSFLHAGDRGWLVESADTSTCDGLSVWPY